MICHDCRAAPISPRERGLLDSAERVIESPAQTPLEVLDRMRGTWLRVPTSTPTQEPDSAPDSLLARVMRAHPALTREEAIADIIEFGGSPSEYPSVIHAWRRRGLPAYARGPIEPETRPEDRRGSSAPDPRALPSDPTAPTAPRFAPARQNSLATPTDTPDHPDIPEATT